MEKRGVVELAVTPAEDGVKKASVEALAQSSVDARLAQKVEDVCERREGCCKNKKPSGSAE
jgi:hypothetical protein